MGIIRRRIVAGIAGAVTLALALTGCGGKAAVKEITMASRDYAEHAIMVEMAKALIEAHTDIKVKHLPNMEFRVIVQASKSGDVDAYLTYSGTQFTTVLGQEVTAAWTDPEKVLEYVEREVDRQYDMKIMNRLGFDNTYAVAVRREFAEANGIRTISDLKAHAPDMTMATDADFLNREEVMSYRNFKNVYGLEFKKAVAMSYGLLYRAARSRDVDAIMAYSSDGRIPAMDLTILQDDKRFFPPYDAMFIIRKETLKKYPELYGVLDKLSGRISQETMQHLNYLADVEGRDCKEIAVEFLKEQGLID
ncbi:MAG: glycine betaine ABC transporter substrate-binding protein [Bacillota bacterium]